MSSEQLLSILGALRASEEAVRLASEQYQQARGRLAEFFCYYQGPPLAPELGAEVQRYLGETYATPQANELGPPPAVEDSFNDYFPSAAPSVPFAPPPVPAQSPPPVPVEPPKLQSSPQEAPLLSPKNTSGKQQIQKELPPLPTKPHPQHRMSMQLPPPPPVEVSSSSGEIGPPSDDPTQPRRNSAPSKPTTVPAILQLGDLSGGVGVSTSKLLCSNPRRMLFKDTRMLTITLQHNVKQHI